MTHSAKHRLRSSHQVVEDVHQPLLAEREGCCLEPRLDVGELQRLYNMYMYIHNT